jgi:hypothetical protein
MLQGYLNWMWRTAPVASPFHADLLAFLFSVDKTDLDPSVNLIDHAAIKEMIKLQFTTITDRIRNKIRNGNWFPKFSISTYNGVFPFIQLLKIRNSHLSNFYFLTCRIVYLTLIRCLFGRYFIFQSWSPVLSRIIIYKLKNIK